LATTLEIVDEGVIWKDVATSPDVRSALKGTSANLGGGHLVHAMQVGLGRTSPDARAMLVRSLDYGRTWSQPAPIHVSKSQGDNSNSLNPTQALLAHYGNGDLRAVMSVNHYVDSNHPRWQKSNGGWLGHKAVLAGSSDQGDTWHRWADLQPPPIEGGFFVSGSVPFQLDNGELMVVIEPMYHGSTEHWRHEAAVMFSGDNGITWGRKSVIAKDPAGRVFYFDPKLTQLTSGQWVCLLWTHDTDTDTSLQTSLSRSEDGHVWSPVEQTPLWGFLTVPTGLADGRLLAVYNHRRNPQGIRCCLSEDSGRTWNMHEETVLWDRTARRVTCELVHGSESRNWQGSLLDEMFADFDFGVPHAIELEDGTVWITFYATEADNIMHQRYLRMKVK